MRWPTAGDRGLTEVRPRSVAHAASSPCRCTPVLYALAAPLRLTVSLLDRVRYVLDESPIAVSATARRVRIVVAAGLLAYAAVLFVGGGMGLIAGLVVSIIALVVGSGKMGLFARDWAPVA